MTELAVTHGLARKRSIAAQLAAQLADDPRLALVQMDPLADQRRAVAVHAAVPIGRQQTNAPLQQMALEELYVALFGSHDGTFAV
jgi:hypothetical protein